MQSRTFLTTALVAACGLVLVGAAPGSVQKETGMTSTTLPRQGATIGWR
jgi:hypothetical protein